LRILFVNHWAREIGGAEMSLLDIMKFLTPRDEVHLAASEQGPLTERAAALGATVHVLPSRHTLYNLKRDALLSGAFRSIAGILSFTVYTLRLFLLIRRTGPDCVHANVPKSHVALFVAQILGYRGPAIFHMREIFKPNSFARRIAGLVLSRRSSRCIAISNAVLNHLPPSCRASASVIYNGVMVPAVPRPERPINRVGFVYLGRVVPWKGCHLVIDAFARLCAAAPRQATLTIVGDTLYWDQSYRRGIERQISSLNLGDACTLLPHTGTPYDILCRHDVFCIGSYLEPFGRVVAEAQACGLPVIGFDSGGIGEIVDNGETGTLAAWGDIEGFTSAMRRFIEDPALIARMGRAGRERTAKLFNRDIQLPKIADFLRESAATYKPL
jgi:glycosyltransferase involved in cell wall biosynthesis